MIRKSIHGVPSGIKTLEIKERVNKRPNEPTKSRGNIERGKGCQEGKDPVEMRENFSRARSKETSILFCHQTLLRPLITN